MSGREKKRAFSCTLSVLAKIFLGPKQCKSGNTIKIVVSAEIAQTKNDTFFWKKVFFDMGEKWVLLTVFLKSCVFFSENTILLCFQRNTAVAIQTLYVNIKQKIDEK